VDSAEFHHYGGELSVKSPEKAIYLRPLDYGFPNDPSIISGLRRDTGFKIFGLEIAIRVRAGMAISRLKHSSSRAAEAISGFRLGGRPPFLYQDLGGDRSYVAQTI
jgi:hypothetical protein